MLVLSRRPTQQIRIGEHITITLVRLSQFTARIGIDAPPEMLIVRTELEDGKPASQLEETPQ